jgi:hypothetical protein
MVPSNPGATLMTLRIVAALVVVGMAGWAVAEDDVQTLGTPPRWGVAYGTNAEAKTISVMMTLAGETRT